MLINSKAERPSSANYVTSSEFIISLASLSCKNMVPSNRHCSGNIVFVNKYLPLKKKRKNQQRSQRTRRRKKKAYTRNHDTTQQFAGKTYKSFEAYIFRTLFDQCVLRVCAQRSRKNTIGCFGKQSRVIAYCA